MNGVAKMFSVKTCKENRVFRFSGIISNSAISLRIRARGKIYLSDIVLDYTRILLFFIVLSDCYTK